MDKKFIALVTVLTLGIIGISILLLGSSSTTTTKATVYKTAGAKISVDHSSRKVGSIPYSGGNFIHVCLFFLVAFFDESARPRVFFRIHIFER